MKKNLAFIIAVLNIAFSFAQTAEPELENGYFVYKYVHQVENLSQNSLYLHTRTFLSDWVGPNANSKNYIDFEDKESGSIIAKGSYFLAYEREALYGWNIYADFSITIKCKDGRFQVVTKVPSMSFYWTAGNLAIQVAPFSELYPTYTFRSPYKFQRHTDVYAPKMPEYIKQITNIVVDGITSISDEDDF